MKIIKLIIVLVIAGLMSACASGPKYTEVVSTFPALAADKGRVFFYRSRSMLGAVMQPSITLNGSVVGTSKPGGFFFVDTAPGNQEVTTSTEVEKKLTFMLDAGQTRFVKTKIGLGVLVVRIHPELVDNDTGEKEVKEASYTAMKESN